MTLLPRHRPSSPASDTLRRRQGPPLFPPLPGRQWLCKAHLPAAVVLPSSSGSAAPMCAGPAPSPGVLCSPCSRGSPSQTLLLQPPSLTWSPPMLAGLCTLCAQTCGEGRIYTWATDRSLLFTRHCAVCQDHQQPMLDAMLRNPVTGQKAGISH